MLASYVHPTNPDDLEEAAEVDATRRVLVRWMNAAFRMMYLKHRGEDASILITEGYLTDDEWEELKDVTKPAMHLYQWVVDVLYQCTSKEFLGKCRKPSRHFARPMGGVSRHCRMHRCCLSYCLSNCISSCIAFMGVNMSGTTDCSKISLDGATFKATLTSSGKTSGCAL